MACVRSHDGTNPKCAARVDVARRAAGAGVDLVDRKITHFEIDAIATVACAAMDPPYDVMTLATAGHPPPVLAVPGRPASFAETIVNPPIGFGFGAERPRAERLSLSAQAQSRRSTPTASSNVAGNRSTEALSGYVRQFPPKPHHRSHATSRVSASAGPYRGTTSRSSSCAEAHRPIPLHSCLIDDGCGVARWFVASHAAGSHRVSHRVNRGESLGWSTSWRCSSWRQSSSVGATPHCRPTCASI